MNTEFVQKLQGIIERDPRYKRDAYEFVMQALWFTQKKAKRQGHVSGRELLEGIREYGIDQYGPMTRTVLSHWGVHATDDFGSIVFNMVDNGILSKTETDSPDDFKNVYDFSSAFDVFRQGRGRR